MHSWACSSRSQHRPGSRGGSGTLGTCTTSAWPVFVALFVAPHRRVCFARAPLCQEWRVRCAFVIRCTAWWQSVRGAAVRTCTLTPASAPTPTPTRRYDALYFGDTGTAVTTLAVCHSLAGGNTTRQQRYAGALARHLNFITDGCQQIPASIQQYIPPPSTVAFSSNVAAYAATITVTKLCVGFFLFFYQAKYAPNRRCPPKGTGWTLGGADAGAVADGYANNALDCLTPYTIAAATCGAAFAELSTIDLTVADGPSTSRTETAKGAKANSTALSIGAAQWIAGTIGADGKVPYIVTPADPGHVLYQPIAYAHAFVNQYVCRLGPHFLFYEVVSVTKWLIPYAYRKIL